MSSISIKWLYDSVDCDQAGCSGGYAEGAIVVIDNEELIELEPVASCFGSENNWNSEDVYRMVFEKLGHTLRTQDG